MPNSNFNLINRFFYILSFLLSFNYLTSTAQNAQWVNPFIGTGKSIQFSMWGNYGGTYPGAVSPWGVVQLTPETSKRPMEMGYYYEDSTILFFSCHSHLSGYPNGSRGKLQISFWPTYEVSDRMLRNGRPFSHADEIARPGYYSVTLDGKDRVEMTTTPHNGFYRYHSSSPETTMIIADGRKLNVVDSLTIQCDSKHTIIRLSRPMKSFSFSNDTARIRFTQADTQNGLNIWLSVSDASFERSLDNARNEIKEWDFDKIRKGTYQNWGKELKSIQVQGKSTDEKIKFYTALYHSSLLPCIVSDTNEPKNSYWLFSPWDTFRSLHPMLSLLKPEKQLEMMNYLMETYKETGKLPKGPMTGFHIIPILLDSWVKGNINATPAEILKASEELIEKYNKEKALVAYREKGFVEAQIELSVSITSELAYNDWALSQLAHLAGESEKSELYKERAYNYQKLLDANTGFMLPRDGDQFLRKSGELGFQESNRWTGSFFVPHNVQDLINRNGGEQVFAERLAKAFDEGKILFDNEPVFHYPYLFTWAGRPDLTVKYVHQILQKEYQQAPGGITGNDDLGSMSSWYVLSAIGLYPACPGSGEYLLSTPLFDRISFPFNGHQLTIIKKGDAPKGSVPSIWIDGKKLNRWYLTHQELAACHTIVYDGTQPLTQFEELEKPYSLTHEKPDFKSKISHPAYKEMESGTLNYIPFQVTNQGETGLFVADLKEGNQVIATKHIQVEKGATLTDSLSFTCYQKGKYILTFNDRPLYVTVKKNKSLKQPFGCLDIEAPSLLSAKDSVTINLTIQNQSEKYRQEQISILVDNQTVDYLSISLESGESKCYTIHLSPMSVGMKEISVLGKKHLIKIFDKPQQACILSLDYGKRQNGKAFDESGFGNHATGHGNLIWKENYVQTGEKAFLSLPFSKSLMTCNQSITLLTWIAPQEKPQGHADFFTKGEYGCLKMEGRNNLVFFIGGWGRGVCDVKVPEDWYNQWHLIAGICTGPTIQLYIDGELKQEIAVAGQLQANEAPWNIGRNAEIPYSRFWDARMARTRIYGVALSEREIKEIFDNEKGYFK